jgi:hypothetical protein
MVVNSPYCEGDMPGENSSSVNNVEWQPPTEDEIRKRAYELHLQRVKESALDDWLEAEAELLLSGAPEGG